VIGFYSCVSLDQRAFANTLIGRRGLRYLLVVLVTLCIAAGHIWMAVSDPAWHTLDEIEPAFVWSNGWFGDSHECHHGGSRRFSELPGATVSVSFVGTAVSLVYHESPDHGIANINIDGIPYPPVDMYAPHGRCQATHLIAENLSPGFHTLTITVSGSSNLASSGELIVVDAVRIYSDEYPIPENVAHFDGKLHVPGEFATIQDAIYAANDGDEVIVAPGTYYETVDFFGKEIIVRSPAGADETVIDGGRMGSVIRFTSSETQAATLEGFTITHGLALLGGGILIRRSSPRILDCKIVRNAAELVGGGICVDGGDPIIQGNGIAENLSTERGGGIGIRSGAKGVIVSNDLTGNLAMEGAGIEVANRASPRIEGNTIDSNYAGRDMDAEHAELHLAGVDIKELVVCDPKFGGGLLVARESQPVIQDNRITRNEGGGIAVVLDCTVVMEGNIITENTGTDMGAGLVVALGSSVTLLGNQICFNEAVEGGAIWIDESSELVNREGGALDLHDLQSAGATRIEEYDDRFEWVGQWEKDFGSCYSGGSRMGTWRAGAQASITFTGTGVSLVYFESPDHGIVDVEIDGRRYASIDMYAPVQRCQAESLITNDLDPGSHTITFTVTGRKRSDSQAPFVVIDALSVLSDTRDADAVAGNRICGDVHSHALPRAATVSQSGRILVVPDTHSTIQAAIDVASPGDAVVVSPGTYHENLDILGKDIVIRSEDPANPYVVAETIIESAGALPTVSFGNETTATLEGFTIRNSFGREGVWIGASSPTVVHNVIEDCTGGIFCSGPSAAHIEHNIIQNNTREGCGAGIDCYRSSPDIVGNTISGNVAGSGAGIFVWFSSARILDNTIAGNEATNIEGNGGGIMLDHFSQAIVEGNCIRENTAPGGGGISLDSFSGKLISRNLIEGNYAQSGGGLFFFLDCFTQLANNFVVGNRAQWHGTMNAYFSSPVFWHNTIAGNTSLGQERATIGCFAHSSPWFVNSIIWDEGGIDCDETSDLLVESCDTWTPLPGVGNLSMDPLFIGSGDYHLSSSSPCVDAASELPVECDFDGNPRPQGERSDIGADEADHGVDPLCEPHDHSKAPGYPRAMSME